MSDFLVLASSHSADPNACAGLRDTAALFNVPLVILGQDKPLGYASNDPRLFLESVPETLAFLRSTDARYIVISDAFDVLCCRWDQEEIAKQIEASAGRLLISCEANCFPDGPWRASYDDHSQSPWRYANAGQFCGTRQAVLALVEKFTEQMHFLDPLNPFGGAAQEILHRLWMHSYPMELDTECRIFQTMFTGASEHVIHSSIQPSEMPEKVRYSSTWAFNRITKSSPMFVHFNGRAPGMDVWYWNLTGKPMPANSMRPEYRTYVCQ